MDKEKIYNELKKILDNDEIFIDEHMLKHTTFKVGGPADILVRPRTEEEFCKVFKLLNDEDVPYLVKGNGSNLLIKDGGIRGVVIEIADNFDEIRFEGDRGYVQTGALLSEIGQRAMEEKLTGFEFASGIPGTLGGALAMNAGAYDGETKNFVHSVRVVDREGNIIELSNEEMEFGYRKSTLIKSGYTALSATIQLSHGNYDEIKEKMDDLRHRRESKQPLEYPSAGSTFKRPEGYFAGKLIQDSGLKGYIHKRARVSPKHSGFVINSDGANATEVIELIEHVKATVFEKFGVRLEEEVKILGEDPKLEDSTSEKDSEAETSEKAIQEKVISEETGKNK